MEGGRGKRIVFFLVIFIHLGFFLGYDGKTANAELWRFDTTNNTWKLPEVKGKPPSARYSHTATVCFSLERPPLFLFLFLTNMNNHNRRSSMISF